MAGGKAHGGESEPAFAEWFALGESEALRRLYERYAPRTRLFCLRRLGNHADAEDAVQETFLKAQQGLHRFDRNAPFWPWLVTIATRVCTDMHRQHEHTVEGDLDVGVEVDPEEQAALRTKVTIVDDALRSMPDRYRTSLFLRHIMGSSYEEIARVQGTSIASVKSSLMRGRRQLGHRIEALARAERQWPLPSTVSVVARRVRDRVRGWYHDLGRVVQGVVGLVDAAASLNALMAHAPLAVAAVGALAVLMDGDPAVPHKPKVEVAPSNAVAGSGTSATALVTISDRGADIVVEADTPSPPFLTVDTPITALIPTDPHVGASARGREDEEGGIWFSVRANGGVVFLYECEKPPFGVEPCEVVRTVFPLPVEPPDSPGVEAGTGPE